MRIREKICYMIDVPVKAPTNKHTLSAYYQNGAFNNLYMSILSIK